MYVVCLALRRFITPTALSTRAKPLESNQATGQEEQKAKAKRSHPHLRTKSRTRGWEKGEPVNHSRTSAKEPPAPYPYGCTRPPLSTVIPRPPTPAVRPPIGWRRAKRHETQSPESGLVRLFVASGLTALSRGERKKKKEKRPPICSSSSSSSSFSRARTLDSGLSALPLPHSNA